MGTFAGLQYQETTASFFLLFLPFFIFLFRWLRPTLPAVTAKKLPPSPPKLPIIGHLHILGSFPHRSLGELARRHGPIMLLHFGGVPVVVVSAADAAREIMKTHDAIFSNRPKSSILARLFYNYRDVASAPYGEYWRQMRSICVLHLLSTRRVQSFRGVREEETALLMEKISSSSSTPVDLTHMFMSLTNDLICRVALGKKYRGDGETTRKYKELLKEFNELVGSFDVGDFIPWLSWLSWINGLDGRVEKVAKEFDRILDEVVKEHVDRRKRGSANEEAKDFVDVLLEIQEDKVTGAAAISEESIKALTQDMFAAGTDTTHTVLEWAMTELLRHPQAMKQLQNEVRGIGRGKLLITEDDLDKMQYLRAVIKETLRLHPPIPLLVPRESIQDATVMGFFIPAGTRVIINAWAIGRDPQLWDEVGEFKPERFLNSSIDFRGRDYELIPFGAGRRGCPGIVFATMAIELVLANVVHRFDWEVGGGGARKDLDMTECTGLAIHRKVPLLAVATPYGLAAGRPSGKGSHYP